MKVVLVAALQAESWALLTVEQTRRLTRHLSLWLEMEQIFGRPVSSERAHWDVL
jgi:hypothetical protein